MNKQEAIERIKNIETLNINDRLANQGVDMVIKNQVLTIIEQIDEPQKIVIPKVVGDWIEWCKTNNVTLLGGISPIDELGSAVCNDKRVKSLTASRWAIRNQDTFARAWLAYPNIEVDMQSTGLFDLNDKEIFEGDILKCTSIDGRLWHETNVSWDSTIAGFVIHKNIYETTSIGYLTDSKSITVEIIGNIYENPELLEVE